MKQSAIQYIHNFSEQIINALQEYLGDVDLHPMDSCLINKKTLDVFISLESGVDATFELLSKYIFAH